MKLLTRAARTAQPNERELDNLRVAYRAACEGMVLLKNQGCLPFPTKKVALYGSGAAHTIKGGTGSGEVNERRSVTILEGLEDRGFEVTSRDWLARYEGEYARAQADYKAEKKKRLNLLKPGTIMDMLFDNFRFPCGPALTGADVGDTDCCIYVLSRQAGEGGDRRVEKGDFLLTDGEEEAIRFCAEHYSRFLLVINCGSSIDMSFTRRIRGIGGILCLCQLGTEGGHAFADVVSGAVTPSGKLSDTWPEEYAHIPFADEYSYRNGELEEEYYKEGIFVGYRYFDTFSVNPAYPFGFGLSYTSFAITPTAVAAEGSRVSVTAEVKNTGEAYSGKEVVQLYLTAPEGALPKEYQALAAFEKTGLIPPGESREVELTFDLAAMASFREEDASFVLEAGDYVLRLGNCSRNTVPVGVVELDREVVVSRHEHICPVRSPLEELVPPPRADELIPPEIPRVKVEGERFATLIHTYEHPAAVGSERTEKILSTLSLEEMVDIVVGIGMFGGETRFTLPGAVGNTTSRFWDRGLANVTLCDGPAGLRLQKRSTVGKGGKVKPVDLAMSAYEMIPAFLRDRMTGDTEREEVLYQYTTAFPVATALCQSWNKELMAEVGEGIRREMAEYGCTYWLAPALNIHRNPLCGRNFEYYSEDPRLTGAMASALIRRVQAEEGYYVTVKHFACNNQEDHRNRVSSNLSERALREIYLKAFEEPVSAAGAKGVMTAYNRINGVYAPNSYDLCTRVLRGEWGFGGVVMTDWFSTGKGRGDNAAAMAAGNDLIMPGGRKYKKAILRGVKSGQIAEEDVRRCCVNVVEAILSSAIQREYIHG